LTCDDLLIIEKAYSYLASNPILGSLLNVIKKLDHIIDECS